MMAGLILPFAPKFDDYLGLVLNGGGQLGNATNFNGVYTQSDAFAGKGSFRIADGYAQLSSIANILVNPSVRYSFSGAVKASHAVAGNMVIPYVKMYDIDELPINAGNRVIFDNTLTTLASPANAGDTILNLTSGLGWKQNLDPEYMRHIGFGGYANSYGKIYDFNATDAYTQEIAAYNSIIGNQITLLSPLAKGYAAGTAVGNMSASDGNGTYVMNGSSGGIFVATPDTKWTKFSGVFGGEAPAKLHSACAFIKIGIGCGYAAVPANFYTLASALTVFAFPSAAHTPA
jgi:hypothetical protein